jgi:uncharacterized protein YyaL (SSP411 family)
MYDGATPSGNSVAANSLWRLSKLTGETHFDEQLEQLFITFSKEVEQYPAGYSHFLEAYLLTQMPSREIVILGKEEDQEQNQLIQAIHKTFLPEVTTLTASDNTRLKEAAPFIEHFQRENEKTTVFYCENFSCQRPTTDIQSIIEKL